MKNLVARYRLDWLNLILALGLAWLASIPFARPGAGQLGLIAAGGILFSLAMQQITSSRQARLMMEQYQILLAYLSSRLAVGETLERALLMAGPALVQQLGGHSMLYKSLKRLDRQIRAQVDLEQGLNNLLSTAVCPPVRPFLAILPQLRQMGGQLSAFVKSSHRMLAEQISLQQDIAAEQSQKNAEALILMILPFALAGILGGSATSYAAASLQVRTGRVGLALAYLLSCLAVTWTVYLLGNQVSYRLIRPEAAKPPRPASRLQNGLAHWLEKIYRGPFFGRWGNRLLLRIQEQSWQKSQQVQAYMEQKVLYLLLGLSLGLAWSLLSLLPPALCGVPGLILAGLQDLRAWSIYQQRKNQYRLAYPAFLNWVIVLLQAGFSLDKTLSVAARAWLPESVPGQQHRSRWFALRRQPVLVNPGHQLIAGDLQFLQQQQQAGRSCTWILTRLAEQNPILEVQSTLHMLIRYEREGGRELLDLLVLQANASWNLQRNGIRKALEARGLQLLLPMMIDLVVILFIAILPAMLMLAV